jgi:hypothetical protein
LRAFDCSSVCLLKLAAGIPPVGCGFPEADDSGFPESAGMETPSESRRVENYGHSFRPLTDVTSAGRSDAEVKIFEA